MIRSSSIRRVLPQKTPECVLRSMPPLAITPVRSLGCLRAMHSQIIQTNTCQVKAPRTLAGLWAVSGCSSARSTSLHPLTFCPLPGSSKGQARAFHASTNLHEKSDSGDSGDGGRKRGVRKPKKDEKEPKADKDDNGSKGVIDGEVAPGGEFRRLRHLGSRAFL